MDRRQFLNASAGAATLGVLPAARAAGAPGPRPCRPRAPRVQQVNDSKPLILNGLPNRKCRFSYYSAAVAMSATSETLGILTPSRV